MAYFLSALITSLAGIAAHGILIASGLVRIDPDKSILKLKRHWQILLIVWAALLPLFIYLSGVFNSCGMIARIGQSAWFFGMAGITFLGMLFFVYLTFYYVVDRSITTRLMMEIERSPEKRLTFEEITKVYDLDTKYRNEIQGIVDGGFMRREGEYFVNTPKGAAVAGITSWYKKVFKLGPGG